MSHGELVFVCTSVRSGTAKALVASAKLIADHGIEGDAHAGSWHRQISLLDERDVESMRAKGLDLDPGAFGENLLLRGIDLAGLGLGSRLAVGDALLELTQVGKVCHAPCAIYAAAGDCIMPRAGLFARVVRGGVVRPGLAVEVIERVARQAVQAAVLTVSDRCAAGTAEDTAGPAAVALLDDGLGAHLAWSGIVPDDRNAIQNCLEGLADRGLDLVLTVGGTGLGPRDVTPEATAAVIEREVPGLGEAMRAASAALTPNAWLSRARAGIRAATLIVNLPGSRRAAEENLAAILPLLAHAVRMLRGDTAHPEADAERQRPAGFDTNDR